MGVLCGIEMRWY